METPITAGGVQHWTGYAGRCVSLGTSNKEIMTGGLCEYLIISHDCEGEETDYIEQLATWAKTPVGEPLIGAKFVVTGRSDES